MTLDTQCAGFVLFNSFVPRGQIVDFIHDMPALDPQFGWMDLHMQDAGGRTLVIFRVDLKRDSDEFHLRFHHEILGRLKKLLGEAEDGRPKGVVQWSMSNVLESVT